MKRFDLIDGKMVECEDGAYVHYDGGGQWMDCTEKGIKRPPYVPTCNDRPLADYVQDWLESNGIRDIGSIYHNPFPIGFVLTCIDRYERAERGQIASCAELVEAAKELIGFMDECQIDPRLGDESDRVFPHYEFDRIRAAVAVVSNAMFANSTDKTP